MPSAGSAAVGLGRLSWRHRLPQVALPRPSLARDAFLFLGVVAGVCQALGLLPLPYDTRAYFTADLAQLYPTDWAQAHYEGTGYLYPPPLAIALTPLRLLGWPIFQVVWTALLFAALWVVAGRWAWLVVVAGLIGVLVPSLRILSVPLGSALVGNVQLLIGAACVLAFRWPHVWALPVLTKVGGGIGILWHVMRREWRALATAILATGVIVVLSFLVAPHAWFDYVHFVATNDLAASPLPVVPIPWPVRLAMSAMLIAVAAPRNARWVLPIAVGWALPALYVDSYWPIWLAAIRLAPRLQADA